MTWSNSSNCSQHWTWICCFLKPGEWAVGIQEITRHRGGEYKKRKGCGGLEEQKRDGCLTSKFKDTGQQVWGFLSCCPLSSLPFQPTHHTELFISPSLQLSPLTSLSSVIKPCCFTKEGEGSVWRPGLSSRLLFGGSADPACLFHFGKMQGWGNMMNGWHLLLLHSKKIMGSILSRTKGLSVWSLYFLSRPVSKNLHLGWLETLNITKE